MSEDEHLEPDSLPDTQPASSQSQTQSQSLFDNGWGLLLPLPGIKISKIVLSDHEYSFGRDPRCRITFVKSQFPENLFIRISKEHFVIRMKLEEDHLKHMVFLEDISSNGTFVNKQLVGRFKQVMLKNQDIISLAKNCEAFVFHCSSSECHWLEKCVREKYLVLKHLGSGGFAEVKLVINQMTLEKFALKKIPKNGRDENKIYKEAKILSSLSHPNIINMVEVINTELALHIVLEFMPFGDLQKYISRNHQPGQETRGIFHQIILGVKYLHDQGITHRDIKPENVLLAKEENRIHAKITDFGLAKMIDSQSCLNTLCGTIAYVAPEIIKSSGFYSNKADVWSLGVLLFYCLSGELPFKRECHISMLEQILSGKFFRSAKWKYISKQASDLVDKMLLVNPKQRITIPGILDHEWLRNVLPSGKTEDENRNLPAVTSLQKRFCPGLKQ